MAPATRTGIKTAPGQGPALETIKRSTGGEVAIVVPVAVGTWGYRAGQQGVVIVPEDARLLSLTCMAGEEGATVEINDGDLIEIPPLMAFEASMEADLFHAKIAFVDTVSYFIQFVAEGAA